MATGPIYTIRSETFRGLSNNDRERLFEDMLLEDCVFEDCGFSMSRAGSFRSVIRNVVARNCRLAAVSVWGGLFDDVLVDGLEIDDLQLVWGAVYRHVTLRGQVGRLALRPSLSPMSSDGDAQRIADANREFYESVDWALDIREADFAEFEAEGIPARLIRRDPDSQVIVTREAAQRGDWRNLNLSGTWWPLALDALARGNYPDAVFVAPKRHRKYGQLVAGLRVLQAAGIAEFD